MLEAVNGGADGITTVARAFWKSILFSSDGVLPIHGGYNCELNDASGLTTVNGTLTIAGSAAVTASNVAVY